MASLGDKLVWTVNLVVAIRVPLFRRGSVGYPRTIIGYQPGECDDLEVVGHAATDICATGGGMTHVACASGGFSFDAWIYRPAGRLMCVVIAPVEGS